MATPYLLLSLVLLFKTQLPTSLAQFYEGCDVNEMVVECVNECNTCEDTEPCYRYCFPGCDCIPGYVRDEYGECIPRSFCGGSIQPFEMQPPPATTEVADSGNCPSETLCRASCNRRKFKNGICLGPKKEYCNCFSRSPPSRPSVPAIGNTEVADSANCPSVAVCRASCIRRKFKNGVCLGPKREYCNCFSRLTGNLKPTTTEVADSPGCPSATICRASCIRRKFKNGICLGPKKQYCNCFSRLS